MNDFFSTNGLGGYFWHTTKPISRYQGWFLVVRDKLMKVVDSVQGKNLNITIPRFSNVMVIENATDTVVSFFLDVRKSYETPTWNRFYTIYAKGGITFIRYNLEQVFVGIYTKERVRVVGRWIERFYSFDKARNSSPFSLWVYHALELWGKRIVIGAGASEEEVASQIEKFKRVRLNLQRPLANACEMAKSSALSLCVYNAKKEPLGMYAGLPWFFQFWMRDQAFSYKILARWKRQDVFSLLSKALPLPYGNVAAYRDLAGNESRHASVDAKLLLQLRMKEFGIKKEWPELHTNNLIFNGVEETWMDSISRQGARIEIQALKLAILKGTHFEKSFCDNVRKYFYRNNELLDGISFQGIPDTTKRPNIFLAAYFYPRLLSKNEWEDTIDAHLKALWLPWGGFATIDKTDLAFQPRHSGEGMAKIASSYHQGDSWFWINNIAALVLHRINKKKYGHYIKAIFDASTRDIVKGVIPGHASELSSASSFAPEGSPVQLWSDITYCELWEELIDLSHLP